MPCRSRRVPRETLLSQPFHRHRTLAWPKQLRPTRSLFFRLRLPPFWPPLPTWSSKCCRPSKRQATRFPVHQRVWPFLEAFLLRQHTQASLPPKLCRLLHLALVSQLLYWPWRLPWPQVGQIILLFRRLCRRFPPQSHRSLARLLLPRSMQPFLRALRVLLLWHSFLCCINRLWQARGFLPYRQS